jgi:hypothetical protein
MYAYDSRFTNCKTKSQLHLLEFEIVFSQISYKKVVLMTTKPKKTELLVHGLKQLVQQIAIEYIDDDCKEIQHLYTLAKTGLKGNVETIKSIEAIMLVTYLGIISMLSASLGKYSDLYPISTVEKKLIFLLEIINELIIVKEPLKIEFDYQIVLKSFVPLKIKKVKLPTFHTWMTRRSSVM